MRLYIVRHGEAKTVDRDPQRGLTDHGKDQAEKVGEFLKQHQAQVKYLFHSTKTRARETAEIIAAKLGVEPLERIGLAPSDDAHAWPTELAALREDTCLVSHLPFVEKLTSLLLSGDQNSISLNFATTGVACLCENHRNWHLEWFVTPYEIIH